MDYYNILKAAQIDRCVVDRGIFFPISSGGKSSGIEYVFDAVPSKHADGGASD